MGNLKRLVIELSLIGLVLGVFAVAVSKTKSPVYTKGTAFDMTFTCRANNLDIVHVYHQTVFYLDGPKGPNEYRKTFGYLPHEDFMSVEEANQKAAHYALKNCLR
jgi:hypothetical protein